MTEVLNVRDLKVRFNLQEGPLDAVRGVSFRVRKASTVALVGESGSGKSVVSQCIMGILPESAEIVGGEILFTDPAPRPGSPTGPQNIVTLDRNGPQMRAIRGDRISIIFQEPMTSLSPLHTVGDQISEALHLHRQVDRATGRELTADMLRLVGFPDPEKALRTYPFELSGGLRQRAMIAMALVCRPALLIADEPTTALDVTIQAQILKLMNDLQDELQMAVLIITHDLGVVANMAEEVVVMYHGEVMEHGTIDHIFRDPRHPYLKALLHAVPRFDMAAGERLIPIREIQHVAGHLLTKQPDAAQRPNGTLLSVENLDKSFRIRNSAIFGGGVRDQLRAVADVSFSIERGECLGLVGESGCGKTTLSKILMRALTADGGAVTFHDGGQPVDVLALTERELVPFRRKIQFIFQDPFGSLNPRMTVYDIISEPLIIHNVGDADYRQEMVKELMQLVGLNVAHLKRYPHSFSGGQRQRIGIARALALKPDLLICDEPVSALDVSIQAQILNLLKDLQSELGLTYLFISHNLAVVDYIADRIAVMCRGRLVELAVREALFKNPVHPYTQALLSAVPDPNPDKRLDFKALMEGKASVPAQWPEPFCDDGRSDDLAMTDLGGGHFVRMRGGGTMVQELAS
ncbi:MAG: ABC transporter ATP-binding protein [Alphaproteobacteria bacterium]|nr:ABC transporter ATP-binding protein [Alphaproteobacteria bacterium]